MRFNLCPAGLFRHRFDKKTHRCACGRWERGYAPKKEPKCPRAECQICERMQAIDKSECMVHHGYKRPGSGFIMGDCPGVGYAPYPKTDALEKYLRGLRETVKAIRNRLKSLPTVASLKYTYTVYQGFGKREFRERIVHKGETGFYEGPHAIPSFDDVLQDEIRATETRLKHLKSEEKRVAERIKKAESLKGEIS